MQTFNSSGMSGPDWHFPKEVCELIASFCIEQHELRTVFSVCRDLAALQSVCRASKHCASALWSAVADLCDTYRLSDWTSCRRSALEFHANIEGWQLTKTQFAKAMLLPPNLVIVYLQVQTDARVRVEYSVAVHQYFLTVLDLIRLKSVPAVKCKHCHEPRMHRDTSMQLQRHYAKQVQLFKWTMQVLHEHRPTQYAASAEAVEGSGGIRSQHC